MSAGSPAESLARQQQRQPHHPYSALFYPAAGSAAAWDLTGASGSGSGGGASDLTNSAAAAAAAAAAALLEPRHHHQHPSQQPQHHGHHLHPQQPLGGRPATLVSRNPFDPQSRIPLPHPFGEYHFGCESSFIRRRNERERERVRFVNEGYERLKETLPFENKDKRISKVEILKTAIRYIQHMESLLRAADQQQQQQSDTRPGRKPADAAASASSSGLKRRPLSHELQQEPAEKRPRHS